MNTVQLECFLSVAEYLSFARAGKQLQLSQPAVSHQIQSLESELGVRLFHRSTRYVELTPAGAAFLDDARRIADAMRDAVHRFRNPDEQEILPFAVGCSGHAQMELLPEVLSRLAALHPNLHPRIETLPSGQLLARTEAGGVDAALDLCGADDKPRTLRYRELAKIPLVCVFHESHPAAARERLTVEEARQYPLILYHPTVAAPELARVQYALSEGKGSSQLYFCQSAEAAILLADAGFGIAVLPDSFLPRSHGLQKRLLVGTDMLSFGVFYRDLRENPLLRDFVHLLRQGTAETTQQR